MDELMKDQIFEKGAGSLEVEEDSNLVKLQQILLDCMRHLLKVWTTVEKGNNFPFKQVEVSLPQILANLDETVMLLGQAFSNISYTRLFNTLDQITGDPRKMKQLLLEKNEIFVKKTQFLFAERFESDIIRTAKSKQKYKEVSSTITNYSHFKTGLYWDTNQIRIGSRMTRWCFPRIIHSLHGNQAKNSTKINIDHSLIRR